MDTDFDVRIRIFTSDTADIRRHLRYYLYPYPVCIKY